MQPINVDLQSVASFYGKVTYDDVFADHEVGRSGSNRREAERFLDNSSQIGEVLDRIDCDQLLENLPLLLLFEFRMFVELVFHVIFKFVASLSQAIRRSGEVANDRLCGELCTLGASKEEIHCFIDDELIREDVRLFEERR